MFGSPPLCTTLILAIRISSGKSVIKEAKLKIVNVLRRTIFRLLIEVITSLSVVGENIESYRHRILLQ